MVYTPIVTVMSCIYTGAEVDCSAVHDPVLLVAEVKLGISQLHFPFHASIIECLVAFLGR